MTTNTQTATNTASTITVTSSDGVHRGPVPATFNFYTPPEDGSKPFNYVEKPPEGQPQRNFSDTSIEVTVNDIRGHETEYNLDRSAFAALTNIPPSAEKDFTDDASVKQNYYPEVEQLLLDHVPGAKRIFLFDHTVRRASPNAHRAPVTRAHIDQTPSSAAARIRHHLPAEADELLRSRYRIINVWRPINGAVESFPLGFADSATVPDEALVGIEHRYPDRTGETAAVKHTDGQRWCYWSGIDDSERILLECYDSENPKGRVPHSAFVDPRSGEGAKPRESIEVRALVFG
ncbi:MAG: hypothetical protein Q9191_006921 [Dirinaria sp. TL-2023a]